MRHNDFSLSCFFGFLRSLAVGALTAAALLCNSKGYAQAELPARQDTVSQVVLRDSLGGNATEMLPLARPEWQSMITAVPGDWVRAANGTSRVEALPSVVGLGALSAALIVTDRTTHKMTKDFLDRHSSVQSTCDFMQHVGDGRVHLAIAATFGVVGFALDDSRALRTGSQTVEALLASGIVVQILKRVSGRESPEVASRGGGVWRFFPSQKEYSRHQARYYAFPSGHIATTMSTVTVIAENYPEIGWIKPVGYTIVGLVGCSLVGVGFHWYGDLPLGIAIGYTFGKIVAHRDDPAGTAGGGARSSALSIAPSIGPTGAGVALAVSF